MSFTPRRLAASAAGLLAIAIHAAPASAATPPTATAPPALAPVLVNFVPPKVGGLRVDIGPVLLQGKLMNPGLHVLLQPPAIQWPPPSAASASRP